MQRSSKNFFRRKILAFLWLGFMLTSVWAGTPLWSFEPLTATTITVPASGSATVQYQVTNQSSKPHTLTLQPIRGVTQITGGINVCDNPFVLRGKSSCTLSLQINGSQLSSPIAGGPVVCQQGSTNQCYQPSFGDTLMITRTTVPGATTLSTSIPSPSILALSVNNPSLNPALTGNARHITITNTGINEAADLTIVYPVWPGGTTASSTCGATLAAGAACTITISPGSNATSSCNTGIAPTPGTITVSAANVATAVTSNVVVLSYGCQYQGGFLYSVDDTTANTGSIGGKVVSLVDQAAPYISSGPQATSIIWSSNGSGSTGADFSYDIIPLISETSVPSDSYANAQASFNGTYSNTGAFPFPAPSAFATCDGASDGQCNSSNILAFYNTYNTGYGIGSSPYTLSAGPTSTADYASGLCTATINSYSDWYLPAICELNAVYNNVTCPAGAQSMVANLIFLIGNLGAGTPSTSCAPPSGSDCLAGFYWSSTQNSGSSGPLLNAWGAVFNTGGSVQDNGGKNYLLGVRCTRALTL